MEVIIATGGDKINPGRFADRTTFADDENPPLGKCGKATTPRHARLWEQFKSEWPWLRESDRAAIEGLVIMRAKLDTPEECDAKFFKQYFDALKAFGGTPGERSRMPKTKDDAAEDDDEDGDSYVQ